MAATRVKAAGGVGGGGGGVGAGRGGGDWSDRVRETAEFSGPT
jgi:hypothetical protein